MLITSEHLKSEAGGLSKTDDAQNRITRGILSLLAIYLKSWKFITLQISDVKMRLKPNTAKADLRAHHFHLLKLKYAQEISLPCKSYSGRCELAKIV